MDWHYAANDERHGPVDESALASLIRSGVIRRDTLVWTSDLSDWTEASKTRLKRYFEEDAGPAYDAVPSAAAYAYAPPRSMVEPEYERRGQVFIPRREALPFILLMFFTCGIYGLYLFYKWAEEINAVSGTPKYNPTHVLLLTIFTCGIAGIYFHIKYAFDLERLARNADLPHRQQNLGNIVVGLFVGGFVLSLVGLPVGIVTGPLSYWFVQAELNKFAA